MMVLGDLATVDMSVWLRHSFHRHRLIRIGGTAGCCEDNSRRKVPAISSSDSVYVATAEGGILAHLLRAVMVNVRGAWMD